MEQVPGGFLVPHSLPARRARGKTGHLVAPVRPLPRGGEGAYACNNPQNFATLLTPERIAPGFLEQGTPPAYPLHKTPPAYKECLKPEKILALQEILSPATDALFDLERLLLDIRKAQTLLPKESVQGKDYRVSDGLILFKDKILMPDVDNLQLQVTSSKHNLPLAGHLAGKKTQAAVCKHYNWPNLNRYVNEFVASCDLCCRNKCCTHTKYGLLQLLNVPYCHWSSISMDHIDQLPQSGSYNVMR